MRVIWIILDSVGCGALPDAAKYNDEGAHTIDHTVEKFSDANIHNLRRLGLGNIEGIQNVHPVFHPAGMYGRCMELSEGKDTITGHWEMVGIHTKEPFKVFPNGFPDDIIIDFISKTKCVGVLGNVAESGTVILDKLGDKSIETGFPIIYTSADSVFQIAACEDTVGIERLYEMCEVARNILVGKNQVARVIARPFKKTENGFVRTDKRRDFAIEPPKDNLLYRLKEAGIPVTGIGKISDIFCGVGIGEAIHTKNNEDGIDKTLLKMDEQKEGLIFTNLVEFDSAWGHRRDAEGYMKGLEAFDKRLPEIIAKLNKDDILIINADHGCDPTFRGTDHTREYVPLLVYGLDRFAGRNLGTRESFADIGASIARLFGIGRLSIGRSFVPVSGNRDESY